MRIKQYLFNNLVAIDQLMNTLTAGYPDETLSARAYRRHFTSKKWVIIMHIINAIFFNKLHCKHAYENEIDLPDEYYEMYKDTL